MRFLMVWNFLIHLPNQPSGLGGLKHFAHERPSLRWDLMGGIRGMSNPCWLRKKKSVHLQAFLQFLHHMSRQVLCVASMVDLCMWTTYHFVLEFKFTPKQPIDGSKSNTFAFLLQIVPQVSLRDTVTYGGWRWVVVATDLGLAGFCLWVPPAARVHFQDIFSC